MKKIICLTILLLLLIPANIMAQPTYHRDVIITSPGAVVTDVRAYANITAAVTAIGATRSTLLISEDETLTASVVIPATTTLKLTQGSSITLGAFDLTINGPFSLGLHQAFNDAGAGLVVFGSGSGLAEIYPEWWGENTTPDTTDMTDELQSAVDSGFSSHLAIALQDTIYRTSKPLLVYGHSNWAVPEDGSRIIGASRESTIIKKYGSANAGTGFSYDSNSVIIVTNEEAFAGSDTADAGRWVHLENLYLLGNSDDVLYGIHFPVGNAYSTYKNIRIDSYTGSGIYIDANHWVNKWDFIHIYGYNGVGFGDYGINYNAGTATTTIWSNIYILSTDVTAYKVGGTYQTMIALAADSNTGIVYHLNGYRGTIIAMGSESVLAETQVLVSQRTDATIIDAYLLQNATTATATTLDIALGGKVQFVGGRIGYDGTELNNTAPGYLYKLAFGGVLSFYNTLQGLATFSPTDLSRRFSFVDGDVTVGADTIDETAHEMETGQAYTLSNSGGALPGGLSAATYYIIRTNADTVELATSFALAKAGTPVDITSAAGGGTHFLTPSAGSFNERTVAKTNGVNHRTGSVYIPATDTVTLTFAFGAEALGPITVDLSGLNTAAAGTLAVKVLVGGYILATDAKNTSKIVESSVNGNFTISAISKTAYGFSIDIINAGAAGSVTWVASGVFSAVTVTTSL